MKKLLFILLGLLFILPAAASAEPLAYNSLNNDLISFWKLDEENGTRLDAVGNNHLTDYNTVGRSVGIIGYAARFISSNSEYLSIADNADLSTGDVDFSISGWFYCEGGTQILISKWGATTAAREYDIYHSGTNLVFQVGDGSSTTFFLTPAASGSWHFFIIWHDASANTINAQIDDGSVNSQSWSTGLVDSGTAFVIGARPTGSFYMDGKMDAVGFWKRVLTADERTLLYNNGNGMEYPFLDPTPTPTSTNTPIGPTNTATATSTSSGTCSDCWYTPTPTPTGYVPTGTLEIAPTPIVMSRPGNSRPTAISTVSFPTAPDPIPVPSPISVSLILIPTPTTSTMTGTGTISLTTISTTLSLSYTGPITLSFSDGVTGSAAYTSASGILATGQGWISDVISYTGWLSGEVATMQATGTFTIYSAPDWYAPDLPRPMADIGWSFEQWYDEGDSSTRRYRLDEWGWLGGYMVSMPFQLLKTLWQLVQFLGPLGLFIAWLLIMLPMVLFFKFFNFVKNLLISLLNAVIKLVGFIRDLIPI